MLANEAAEMTTDGIRDLVDEDAEVDAAASAAIVRQASNRAIFALKRLRQLEDLGSSLAFGKVTKESGEKLYVGRHSVIDDEDALLVDWRAEAATPFYRATYSEPLGCLSRRHFFYSDSNEALLEDFSDEVFGVDYLTTSDVASLRGEAAVLASVESPTVDSMKSVVATIQAEQDEVVRAPANRPLVVQGGPGTGKTVVALHRAAYLLYHYRVDLEDTGILVVGPTAEFLNYIARVIPSLGESGVVSLTPEKLYQGVRLGHIEAQAVAQLKGSAVMAELLRKAVELRQIQPDQDWDVWYGASKQRLSEEFLQEIFQKAKNFAVHNEGAAFFKSAIVNELVTQTYSPSFDSKEELKGFFKSAEEVREISLRYWPDLSPEQALNDLLGSKAMLLKAGKELLKEADLLSLHRKRSNEASLAKRRWSEADVPLLDEMAYLLDGLVGEIDSERLSLRDRMDEFERAMSQDEADSEVELAEYDDADPSIDPIDPTDFWKSSDPDLELFPIMYDQAEGDT